MGYKTGSNKRTNKTNKQILIDTDNKQYGGYHRESGVGRLRDG